MTPPTRMLAAFMIVLPELRPREVLGAPVTRGIDDEPREDCSHRSHQAVELLMPVALHAAADHSAFQHIQCREQCRRAMTLVVMLVWTATDGIDVPE
jgi:hypothetical protein